MSYFSIDDTNTTLIQYNGAWDAINGSTRQWDGTAHSTGEAGATATFQFTGYILRVWGTVAGGVGMNKVQLTIDGGTPNITSQTSNGAAIFNVIYFETPLLSETLHTAVVTNLQSASNGSSVFELDKFEFITTDVTPVFSPPDGSTILQSVPQVPSATSSSPAANTASSRSSSSLLAPIVGGVAGVLGLIVALLLFLLWRRRRPNGTIISVPTSQLSSLLTPFPLNNSTIKSSNDSESQSSRPILPEKSHFRPESSPSSLNPTSISVSPSSPSSSQLPASMTSGSSSSTQPPTLQIASTSTLTSPELLARDDSTLRYPSLTGDRTSMIHSPLSSSINMYDNPPPSYWYSRQDEDRRSQRTGSPREGSKS